MAEVDFTVDVPDGLEDRFEQALKQALGRFAEDVKFELADDILHDSELTEEQAIRLGRELKERVAERHAVL